MAVVGEHYLNWVQQALSVQVDPRLTVRTVAKVAETDNAEDERGIFTSAAIPARSTLAIVPMTALLTVETAKADPAIFGRIIETCREDDVLSLLLLREVAKGSNSKWFTHLQALPKHYHSVPNYSEDELNAIQGSNLYVIARQWKTQIRNDFESLTSFLQDILWDTANFIGAPELTFDRYLWALSTIWSRFITIEKSSTVQLRAMVPLIDFLNHRPNSQVGHAFNSSDNQLYLYTAQDLSKESEIFISYGHNPNSRLLMLYGFCLIDNPDACVEMWASMAEDVVGREEKTAVLDMVGIDHKAPFKLFKDTIPSDLLSFLRLQHSNLAQVKKLLINAESPFSIRNKISEENELQATQALARAINDMLGSYPNTIEQDKQRLIQYGILQASYDNERSDIEETDKTFQHPVNREEHALILVYSEKVVLHSIINKLSS